MVLDVLLALLLSSGQQPPRDAAPASSGLGVGTATIAGVVVTDDADQKPVRRARVSILRFESRAGVTVITDDAGRFVVRDVPAGRYTISTSKNGWVGKAYGATRPGRPGTPITLAEGHAFDKLILRLARGAVITGIVSDESGRPLPRATVRPFRFVFQNGTRTLIPAGPVATSDDRGVYRIFGLAAGQYLVGTLPHGPTSGPSSAEMRQTTDADIQRALSERGQTRSRGSGQGRQEDRRMTVAYSTVFYPGTAVPSHAALLTVSAAEERTGIDFQVSLVLTSRVEGMVVSPDGGIPPNASVNLISSETGSPGFGFENFRMARTNAEGRFTFAGLPPGKYAIISRAALPGDTPLASPPGRPSEPMTPSLWAMSEVVLDGQHLSGITLTLQPGFTVSGRLEFKGSLAPPDLTRMRVQLMPITMPGQVSVGVSPAAVTVNGTFTVNGVAPGTYRLMSTVPNARPDQPGYVLTSAVVDGRDTLDAPLELRQSITDIVLTFTDRASELSGRLQDPSGKAAPEYYIIVFAADRAQWIPQSRRVRMMRPAADGMFRIRNLPAGDYFIAAVTDIEDGEWTDPNVLQQLAAGSMKLTLADGEVKVQDIQVGAAR